MTLFIPEKSLNVPEKALIFSVLIVILGRDISGRAVPLPVRGMISRISSKKERRP
jgi:hypothetical protein